jgi:hypothetical protein
LENVISGDFELVNSLESCFEKTPAIPSVPDMSSNTFVLIGYGSIWSIIGADRTNIIYTL